MSKCTLCPRECGIDREKSLGFCRAPNEIKIARAALHHWEEPCISGTRGSGTIFFSGCSLGCAFCQNRDISRGGRGSAVSAERFREICFELKDKGAHNVNLVTPMHYAPAITEALLPIKDALAIPVVCNTGGYDRPEAVRTLSAVTDCYLPDFKFASAEVADRYCHAPDYPKVAVAAIAAMLEAAGSPVFDENGILQKGVIVRHLILPGHRKDSMAVLDILASEFGSENILLSLMSQYTPQPGAEGNLARRLTDFEYKSVLAHAEKLGFGGYMQDRASASAAYTPDFDGTGVENAGK